MDTSQIPANEYLNHVQTKYNRHLIRETIVWKHSFAFYTTPEEGISQLNQISVRVKKNNEWKQTY